LSIEKSIKIRGSSKQSFNKDIYYSSGIMWEETSNFLNELSRQKWKSKRIIGFFLGYSMYLGIGGFEGEGIGRFVIRLIEGLLDNDKEALIIILTNNQNYHVIEDAFKKCISNFPNRLFIESFKSVDWINKNIPVDIWIVPYIGMELALWLKKPFIVCLHDLVYMHFEEMYKAMPNFYDEFTCIANKVAKKAVKVVFNSNFIRNNEGLKFLKLPKWKTHVIRLAPPKKEYETINLYDEKAFRDKYNLHNKYIVYPSVIRYHKNHDRLIEAFLKFRGTKEGYHSKLSLVLTDNYLNRPKQKEIMTVLNKCKDINLRNSIIFLGRLPSNDVPLLYKYAVGTIIPTLFEGSCPFQILESLTMNTPVAMSNIEVVKEIITDIDNLITFNPYSSEEIQKAIEDLWKADDLKLKEQKKATLDVMTRTWADVAQEYQTLIEEVIE
jgi:glycosyltransferase involved in cell wall biosynthesis